jgi:hypothetical protein
VQVFCPKGVLSEVAQSAEVVHMAGSRNQRLLRDVNARIREISDRFGTPQEYYRFLCECGDGDCDERVEVEVALYAEMRRARGFFFPGHASLGPEAVPGLVAAEPVRFQ